MVSYRLITEYIASLEQFHLLPTHCYGGDVAKYIIPMDDTVFISLLDTRWHIKDRGGIPQPEVWSCVTDKGGGQG